MKFKPENHITGKVYDLTQENMNDLIRAYEELYKAHYEQEVHLDAALLVFNMSKRDNEKLRIALQEIVDKGPASPGDKKHEIAKAALGEIYKRIEI